MKRIFLILMLILPVHLFAQYQNFENQGYYVLTMSYNVHGSGHDATCSSQIWVKAHFTNSTEEIYKCAISVAEDGDQSGFFSYIFPTNKLINRLEIWTERDYTEGAVFERCEDGGEGTTWVNNITYPSFSTHIQGMPAYNYARSYMDISISPLTNKNLLQLSFVLKGSAYFASYRGTAEYTPLTLENMCSKIVGSSFLLIHPILI